MKLPRRQFLHLAAGAAALPAVSRIARAQAYPSRPVHLIVPIPAGSSADIQARLMGQWLFERLAQPFVVENKPGASNNVGTEAVVRAAPDGYMLLAITAINASNASLYDKLSPRHSAGGGPSSCAPGAGGSSVVSSQVGSRVHRLCQS